MTDLLAPALRESAPVSRGVRDDALAEFSQLLFAAFVRADQRRWGEVYMRGLLGTPGRKTLARISEHVLGERAIQPLQQFLNQSPWDHVAVRRSLARTACSQVRPQAWSVDDVVFPKHGRHSAGVDRQFVPHEGRMLNCQLGMAVSATSDGAALPVDWRMMLPPRWDRDHELRAKAHLPGQVRHRPRWQHVLSMVDEVVENWHLPPAPILVDCRHEPEIEPLLRGLESRGLNYVIEVSPTAVVRQPNATHPTAGPATRHGLVAASAAAAPPVRFETRTSTISTVSTTSGPSSSFRTSATSAASGSPGTSRGLTAAQCVHIAAHRCERTTLAWIDGGESGPRRSQFLAAPVPGLSVPDRDNRLRAASRPRRVVAEWPVGLASPRAYWITNVSAPLAQVVALSRLRAHSARALTALRTDLGLADFEGRSFRGWHHHVTLVSAAHCFRALATLAGRRLDPHVAPPSARHDQLLALRRHLAG